MEPERNIVPRSYADSTSPVSSDMSRKITHPAADSISILIQYSVRFMFPLKLSHPDG